MKRGPPAASFLERKLGKELCTDGTYYLALRMRFAEKGIRSHVCIAGPLLPALAPTLVFGAPTDYIVKRFGRHL